MHLGNQSNGPCFLRELRLSVIAMLSGLDVVLEKFDKRTARRIDSRSRPKASLTFQAGQKPGEVGAGTLVLRTNATQDVWVSRGFKVFDESISDGKLFINVPEYHIVLLISNGKEVELARLAASIRSAIMSATENHDPNTNSATLQQPRRPAQLLHPPSPEERLPRPLPPPPPTAPIRQAAAAAAPSPSKKPSMTFMRSPQGKGSGLTPCKKKERVQSSVTPPKPPLRHVPVQQPAPALLAAEAPVRLTRQQKAAVAACVGGRNVFITGGAGTGKSCMLGTVVDSLRRLHGTEAVFVTATTGLAACLVGGTTVHQFAGLSGAFNDGDDVERIAQGVMGRGAAVKRWRQCKVLVVDEVSMLSRGMLELLDAVARRCRGCSKVMGGVQLVLLGDFFQLPPVCPQATPTLTESAVSAFAFNSVVWTTLRLHVVELDCVFRQADDAEFVQLLSAVRWGRLSSEQLTQLNERVPTVPLGSGLGEVLPTSLFTHKSDVDRVNTEQLGRLTGEVQEYTATDSGDNTFLAFLDKNCQAKKALRLKVGAQVILLRALDAASGLVNGARGVVVRFDTSGTASTKRSGNWPVVRFVNGGTEKVVTPEVFSLQQGGRTLASRLQIPLDCAWALSIHKSQGMSVDSAVLHLKHVFEYGQAYVALSRLRTRAGLALASPIQQSQVRAHPDVVAFYTKLREEREREGEKARADKEKLTN